MSSTRKRMRRSFGGRWTDQERSRLWNLRNSHRKLPWEVFRANYFPSRSITALQKQYSDIKLSLKRLNAMDLGELGELSNGSNYPSRTSARLGKRTTADNDPATVEPLSKQTRISDPDTEYSPPESEDSSSSDDDDDDDGDVQMNGSRVPQRTPRKQPSHPSRVIKLPLAHRERPHASTTAAVADEQPGVPSISASKPVAPPQPPRTSAPHVEERPAMMQSSTQLMGKSDEPQRDKGALSTSSCAKEAPVDHIAKLFRSVCKSMEERAQRRADLQVEQLKKELRSEKEQVLHLRNRLELKNAEANHLTELVGKKEAERDHLKELFEQKKVETKIQLDSLTAELQDQKARMDQMSRHVPCPVCTEKVQQLDQMLAIWRGQQSKATLTPEATVPGCG